MAHFELVYFEIYVPKLQGAVNIWWRQLIGKALRTDGIANNIGIFNSTLIICEVVSYFAAITH